ncbi:transposase [Salmonella enterica]|uniref:transposase n=1 Tax=Salmonella enterica TaxID=28901 RepID=UPI00016C196D|nr:transposase [Salmonella enterica]
MPLRITPSVAEQEGQQTETEATGAPQKHHYTLNQQVGSITSRVLKPEKERAQLSLLEGSEYDYFFFVTNTTLLSEKVVIYYEKRGNAENYIKEAKYDMAVGHLLLKSFWANEAVFQMMMLSYNLFLLFKFDSLDSSEYRQQIKTFRLKYVFLAAKIIKTARYVIMKLSENYPYKGVYEKCLV